jgi:methyl-accepting chemotaxis protein
VSASPERPLSLRSGLRRLSGGLLVYGAIGLLIALLGLVALVWVGGRIDALAERARVQVDAVIASLDETANLLTVTGATAGSFGGTLNATASTVGQAADTIRAAKPRLTDLEGQFRSINILGNQPLSSAADVVAEINAGLEGLDSKLDLVGDSLLDNQTSLDRNAAAMTSLGVRLGELADRLEAGIGTVADVQAIITVTLLVFTAWTAVPAVGAIGLGLWLRRELAGTDDDASAQLVA